MLNVNFAKLRGRNQLSESDIRSDRILRSDLRQKMKNENNEIIVRKGDKDKANAIEQRNELRAGRRRAVGPLYDATDTSSRSIEIVREGVPRREQIIRLRTGVPAMAFDETPRCFFQLPISV
ncbi:unnamed protein product [Onchocerca ochengi]|uniref:IBB domain-containing protein n=1 Tax=Onchocerca ochengi TaxID=42157 RepID=A0A182EMB8_ONCOC|nr:unnamed protein product [Onchocerca ochengi]